MKRSSSSTEEPEPKQPRWGFLSALLPRHVAALEDNKPSYEEEVEVFRKQFEEAAAAEKKRADEAIEAQKQRSKDDLDEQRRLFEDALANQKIRIEAEMQTQQSLPEAPKRDIAETVEATATIESTDTSPRPSAAAQTIAGAGERAEVRTR